MYLWFRMVASGHIGTPPWGLSYSLFLYLLVSPPTHVGLNGSY